MNIRDYPLSIGFVALVLAFSLIFVLTGGPEGLAKRLAVADMNKQFAPENHPTDYFEAKLDEDDNILIRRYTLNGEIMEVGKVPVFYEMMRLKMKTPEVLYQECEYAHKHSGYTGKFRYVHDINNGQLVVDTECKPM